MTSRSFALVQMTRQFNEKVGNGGVTTTKAYNPYLIIFLIRTPMFEWFVVGCGSKNGYEKDTC